MSCAECGKELTAPYSEVVENTGGRSGHETPYFIDVGRAGVSEVVQSDDGRYRLGLHDDTSPGFETRPFAAAVLALERPPPYPEMRSRPAGTKAANRKVNHLPQENTKSAVRPQEISISWGSA